MANEWLLHWLLLAKKRRVVWFTFSHQTEEKNGKKRLFFFVRSVGRMIVQMEQWNDLYYIISLEGIYLCPTTRHVNMKLVCSCRSTTQIYFHYYAVCIAPNRWHFCDIGQKQWNRNGCVHFFSLFLFWNSIHSRQVFCFVADKSAIDEFGFEMILIVIVVHRLWTNNNFGL